MKNLKKGVSLLLSLLLVLGAVSTGLMSVSAAMGDPELYVVDTGIDIVNGGSYFDGKAVYDPLTKTLTLDGLELETSGSAIYAQNLDFTLKGSAKITSNLTTAIDLYNGSLTLEGRFTVQTNYQVAISATDNLIFNGGILYAKTEKASYAIGSITLKNGAEYVIGDSSAKEVKIKSPGYYETGDIIEYGTYPQSRVTDDATLTALNALAPEDFDEWTSYGYYYSDTGSAQDGKMKPGDFMRYYDAVLGGVKYRAVKFTDYRPIYTSYTCSADHSIQDESGYETNTVYWFKYEPIEWRVLDPDKGLVLCESAIDSQAFNNYNLNSCGNENNDYYSNNYENSSIRAWLSDDFMNAAFSASQQENIKITELTNEAFSTEYSGFNSDPTNDKVYLLSYSDAKSGAYDFGNPYSEYAGEAAATDYSLCQGLGGSDGFAPWRLRTPGDSADRACVYYGGRLITYYFYTFYTYFGIRPAMCLSEIKNDPTGAPFTVKYPLWVGGNQVTSENMGALEELDGISVDEGGSVTFVPDDDDKGGTLYLNNATITGAHEYTPSGSSSVYTANILVEETDFDLTISLAGENTVNGDAYYGIWAPDYNSDLTITLTITGEGALYVAEVYYGIYCDNNLTIENTTVNATALGESITSNATNITGSAVKAKGNNDYSSGLYSFTSLNIANSTVEATGGYAGIYVDGFHSNEGLTVSGISAVTAEGGASALFSKGGYHFEGSNDIVTPENFKYGTLGVGTIVLNSDDSIATKAVIGQPCTVTFNDYDGNELQSGKILKGTAPEYKGETPVRTDESGQYTYTFSGWNPEISEVTEDTVYTANYTKTPVDYTATFKANGETVAEIPFNVETEKLDEPAVPAREGYEGKWSEYTLAANNIEITAEYTAIGYTATFKADGETVAEIPFTVETESITAPEVPAKEGYEGVWSEYTLTASNIEINAEYTAIGYTATFIADGETVAEIPFTVETESITAPEVPAKEGYEGKWSDYTLTASNIEIAAEYTAIGYTATFIADGETVAEVPFTVETESITAPEVPAKEGYEGVWSEYTLTASNIEITAEYTAIEYTATFIADGETVAEIPFTVETESITAPEVPAKEGYEGKWSEYTLAASDIEITAEYTIVEYTATFIADGETVAEIKYTVETESIEAPEVPAKEGFTGEWEEYELTPGGITVNAVYTENEPENLCPLDKEDHGEGFLGRVRTFIHTLIWKAFRFLGLDVFFKVD